MPNAARKDDMHLCPKTGPGNVPHVGGPVDVKPGRTVYMEKKPAATAGDPCPCKGDPNSQASPDKIKSGSSTVFIQGNAAARVGDPTEHGGSVLQFCKSVSVGG